MMPKRSCVAIAILGALVLTLVSSSSAQAPENEITIPREGPGYRLIDGQPAGTLRLLDRGSVTPADASPLLPHMSPMNTLAVGMATPMITTVSIGFFPLMTPGFVGNFYTAPADFPSSYYPFFVTGAFAWAVAPPPMLVLGAGVAPMPFPIGTMMWAAFVTAPFPGPPAMTSGVFGAPMIFPHAPPTVAVMPGLGVACGLVSSPVGVMVGAIITPMPRTFHSFSGPPVGADFLSPRTFILTNNVAAGCFISGSTVPVELQSFTIE